MKKVKRTQQLFSLIFIFLLAFSCSKDSEFKNTKFISYDNFVELSKIKEIAGEIIFPAENDGLNLKATQSLAKSVTKSINSVDEVRNKSGQTSFYVVNYNEGGFVILSADNRTQPILGFSVTNKFTVNENSYPPGLKFWIEDTKEQIYNIQLSNIEQTSKEKVAWELVKQSIINEVITTKSEPGEDCYEHTEIYTKGPLTSTLWHQSGGFNDALPFITCNGSSFQVYAGCAPIAMAQIMKYYQYPSNYDWSSMPLTSATSTTADFIEDIHYAIGNVYSGQPYYDCGGTGISLSADMGYVLKTQFSYSSATKADYNYSTVESNISDNRPVMLIGTNDTSGHMWVCDGYRTTTNYFEDCTAVVSLHFYMKWGWYNGAYNGWFAYNNFNPGNTNYNSNKTMIYDIIP